MGSVRNDILAVNPSACTPEAQAANWVTQNTINNNFSQTIGTGSGDTYKVAVDATDLANATPDYLHAKINDHGTADFNFGVIVRSQTIGHATEQFYWSADDIPGYNPSKILSTDTNGYLLWADPNTAVDSFTVGVSSGDSTPKFLHDCLKDTATYVGGADIIVAGAVDGAHATNQHERFFVDVSAMTGWAGTGTFVWMTIDNVTQLIDVSVGGLGDTYKVKSTANDTTPAYLHTALNNAVAASTYVLNEDPLVVNETVGNSGTDQTERCFVDSSGITGFGSIPNGETWRLSITRSGSTYSLKWAADTTPDNDEAFGYITVELQAATGLAVANAGPGMAQEVDENGNSLGSPVEIWNRHFNKVAVNVTVYWKKSTGEFKRAGCAPFV